MARRRHCHGKDTIATTTIDQHCRTTAAASEDDNSRFNTAFAAAVNIAAATAVAAAITIAFSAAIAAVLALSAAITVVVVAAVAAATAAATAADAAATTPSPLPPLSLSLQPPPTSLHLRCSCRWLVVVLSVAPCLLRCPPSKFVSPPVVRSLTSTTTAIAAVNLLPSPLPRSTTTTAKSHWLSFVVVNGSDDDHR